MAGLHPRGKEGALAEKGVAEAATSFPHPTGPKNDFCRFLCVPAGSRARERPRGGQNSGRSKPQGHTVVGTPAQAAMAGLGAGEALDQAGAPPKLSVSLC